MSLVQCSLLSLKTIAYIEGSVELLLCSLGHLRKISSLEGMPGLTTLAFLFVSPLVDALA